MTPAPCASSSSSTDAKLDLLPRLRREMLAASRERDEQQGSREDAMAARLQRMRIEDRRRERNEQMKRDRQQGRSSGSAPSPTRQNAQSIPGLGSASASGSSASSRAGLSYYASSNLARQDRITHDQERQLRRTYAGPVPPGSWRRQAPAETAAATNAELTSILSDDVENEIVSSTNAGHVDRRLPLQAARHFFPETNVRGPMSSDASSSLPSLVDATLHAMHKLSLRSQVGSRGQQDETETERLREDLRLLPLHLKERSLALSGRVASAAPMNGPTLVALLAAEDDDEESEVEDDVQDGEYDPGEEDSFDDGGYDSWEQSRDHDNDSSRASLQNLDLSFCTASTKIIRGLLESTTLASKSLRAISFAGWGIGSLSGAPVRCLRSSSRIFQLLDRFPNLEVLSLASTRLLRPDEEVGADGEAQDGMLSAAATSEALAFLRKLARRTVRLRVLDLSYCTWINGAVIANMGWYTSVAPVRRILWTRLEHLVLWSCPAFSQLGDDVFRLQEQFLNLTGSPMPSAPFAGHWHAAHHGVKRFTDSPYFLDHKPGLGRALLAHSVGAWDLAGRRGLVEREVSALIRHRHYGLDEQTEHIRPPRWAVSDGSALSSLSYSAASSQSPSAAAEPPKCPVSGQRITRPAWERARVLDAVRGRWGSAILGGFDDALDSAEDSFFGEPMTGPSIAFNSAKTYLGAHISVYF